MYSRLCNMVPYSPNNTSPIIFYENHSNILPNTPTHFNTDDIKNKCVILDIPQYISGYNPLNTFHLNNREYDNNNGYVQENLTLNNSTYNNASENLSSIVNTSINNQRMCISEIDKEGERHQERHKQDSSEMNLTAGDICSHQISQNKHHLNSHSLGVVSEPFLNCQKYIHLKKKLKKERLKEVTESQDNFDTNAMCFKNNILNLSGQNINNNVNSRNKNNSDIKNNYNITSKEKNCTEHKNEKLFNQSKILNNDDRQYTNNSHLPVTKKIANECNVETNNNKETYKANSSINLMELEESNSIPSNPKFNVNKDEQCRIQSINVNIQEQYQTSLQYKFNNKISNSSSDQICNLDYVATSNQEESDRVNYFKTVEPASKKEKSTEEKFLRPRKSRNFGNLYMKKERRTREFLKRRSQILARWFVAHYAHPYPTKAQKDKLASATNMTKNQVSEWFGNMRRRIREASKGLGMTWEEKVRSYNGLISGKSEPLPILTIDDTPSKNKTNNERTGPKMSDIASKISEIRPKFKKNLLERYLKDFKNTLDKKSQDLSRTSQSYHPKTNFDTRKELKNTKSNLIKNKSTNSHEIPYFKSFKSSENSCKPVVKSNFYDWIQKNRLEESNQQLLNAWSMHGLDQRNYTKKQSIEPSEQEVSWRSSEEMTAAYSLITLKKLL